MNVPFVPDIRDMPPSKAPSSPLAQVVDRRLTSGVGRGKIASANDHLASSFAKPRVDPAACTVVIGVSLDIARRIVGGRL